ncbi:hypothetical protein GOG43_06575 [Salmonella enterica subsp. enterica]|nr:hypothetical protein [Salmonella enterica subsp. enterica serovar Wagenia]
MYTHGGTWKEVHHDLTDTKVRSAKPEDKEYSLVDGDGMSLLVKPK